MGKTYIRKILKNGAAFYLPIPAEIRNALILNKGDLLAVWVDGQEIRATPVTPTPRHHKQTSSRKPWNRLPE